MIIKTAINSFGTDPVAAWTAYGKLDSLYWMMCSSFGVAITTFVGQNYGARQYQRVRSCIRQCFLIVTLTTLVMVWFFNEFGGICLQLFTEDQEVLRIGTEIIHFMVPFFITYTAIEVLSGSLRGMGDAMRPMIIDVLGICVLRIIWIFVAVPIWPSVRTVIASYPITWITTSILFLIYYFWYIRKHHIGTSSSK
jgi:Na+-driven multidrug efflux pump